MLPSASASMAGSTRIQPSAPMPVWRSQMARATVAYPPSAATSLAILASSRHVSRKSFFAPCALVKGMVNGILISLSPVDLDHRRILHHDRSFQRVANPVTRGAVDGALGLAAAGHDGPRFVQKKIGARDGGFKRQAVITGKGVAQRDSHFPV